MKSRKHSGGANVIMITLIGFFVFNFIAGGVFQAKNGGNVIREDLDITEKDPIVWDNDEGTITVEPVTPIIISEEPVVTMVPEGIDNPNNPDDKENKLKLESITEDSTTTERIEAIFEYLISKGFTPAAAAGVIGNIAVESCFDPTAVSKEGHHGLFQWNTSEAGNYWWYKISNWLTENGYEEDSFEGQVRAFVECPYKGLMTDERLSELKNLKMVAQATELVTVFYEGCIGGDTETEFYAIGTCYQGLDIRRREAWVAYRMYLYKLEYYGIRAYFK